MQDWIFLKSAIQAGVGVDSGAAHVLASVVALIAVAALLRRPLWSWLSWSAVLVLELLNEAATGFADNVLEDWEIAGSLRDIPLVMAMPTILLLICRLTPRLVAPPPPPIRAMRSGNRRSDDIIDADFEELP